jgi:hypothetical protein
VNNVELEFIALHSVLQIIAHDFFIRALKFEYGGKFVRFSLVSLTFDLP